MMRSAGSRRGQIERATSPLPWCRSAIARIGEVRNRPHAGRIRAVQWKVAAASHGAGSRSRTRDLLITNQLLYQLSYAGAGAILAGHPPHPPQKQVALCALMPAVATRLRQSSGVSPALTRSSQYSGALSLRSLMRAGKPAATT